MPSSLSIELSEVFLRVAIIHVNSGNILQGYYTKESDLPPPFFIAIFFNCITNDSFSSSMRLNFFRSDWAYQYNLSR